MHKPILFVDFYRTISFGAFWVGLSADEYERVSVAYDTVKIGPVVLDWMRGKYTAEEVNRLIAERADVDYERLWDAFVQSCKSMRVAPELLVQIGALRERYTTILITDNMDNFTRFTAPTLQPERYFDVVSNSYHLGKLKGDDGGSLFTQYCIQHEADITESVLLDDSSENCDVFTLLGGTAYRVTPEHPAEEYLAQL